MTLWPKLSKIQIALGKKGFLKCSSKQEKSTYYCDLTIKLKGFFLFPLLHFSRPLKMKLSETLRLLLLLPRAGSGLFFPTRFGFRALFFSPVQFWQKMFLFGSPLGQNYYYSGQFLVQSLKRDFIFLNSI